MTITGFADEIAPDLATQMEVLKKLGISYIEMRGVDGDNLIFHSDEKVREIKKRLDANGFRLSALGSPLGKIGITEDFAPHFEAFKRAVEIAHVMEAPRIRMFSFYLPGGEEPKKYEQAVFDRIGQFADYAAANQVTLLHENEKGIYGEMARECLNLMEQFGGEYFKAIFDFANFVQAKQDTLQAYELLRPYIAYIHVKDAVWESGEVVPVGFGDGNVEQILRKLREDGYDGFLSLEPHLSEFKGFSDLEQGDGRLSYDAERKLTGEEAYTLAFDSLQEILRRLS